MKIYYWPDGFWCEGSELEAHLSWRSDDFGTIELDDADHYEDHQIEAMVQERIS